MGRLGRLRHPGLWIRTNQTTSPDTKSLPDESAVVYEKMTLIHTGTGEYREVRTGEFRVYDPDGHRIAKYPHG